MKVVVALFGKLRSHLPTDRHELTGVVEIPEGSRVWHVLKRLDIPNDIPLTVFINHVKESQDAMLKDGDRLSIFPPLAGG